MMTYEMIGVADQNDRTYECYYGTYNKKDGFKFEPEYLEFLNGHEEVNTVDNIYKIFDELFHKDMWKLKKEPEAKKMSLADIEKELGYRVQIVDPEINKPDGEKKELSDEQKEEVNSLVDLFHRLFDIDIDPKKYY